jgi:alpha-tubulin suppressor-like RCC1 family protein
MRKLTRNLASAFVALVALAFSLTFAACSGDDDPAAPVAVTGVTVSQAALRVTAGKTAPLAATVAPADAANKNVAWTSSPAGVVNVTGSGTNNLSATVTALAAGTSDITVTTEDGGFMSICTVTVTLAVTGVTVDPAGLALGFGGGPASGALTATVQPEGVSDADKGVTWASGDPLVAAISGSGATVTITAVAPGTATITATSAADPSKPAGACTVTVTAAPSVKVAHTTFSGGDLHSLAIKADGSLWAWGFNMFGQLGLGDAVTRDIPAQVGQDYDWASVQAGADQTIALKSDGTIWAWGLNDEGQLGLGDTQRRNVPTQVGTDSDWTTVATRGLHTMAIKRDGSLWAWGPNWWGQLGVGDTVIRYTPTRVGGDEDWATVTCGFQSYVMALKTDGSLWTWGNNFQGQLGNGSTIEDGWDTPAKMGADDDWVSVSGGEWHTVALKADGGLWVWGNNWYGQLGDGSTQQRRTPFKLGEGWASAKTGFNHTLAFKADGDLWIWGWNNEGQLGLGNYANRSTPVNVGAGWAAVAGGSRHTLAIKADGTLWACGFNAEGQLGLGGYDNRTTFAQVGEGFRVPAK